MAVGDLTTLATVKGWRNPVIASSTDDITLQREITAASKAILTHLHRKSLALRTYTEVRNGIGTEGMTLRNYPVWSVSAVSIGEAVIPAAVAPNTSGYVWDAELGILYLRGRVFDRGFQNVKIIYQAGYASLDEEHTIPNTAPFVIPCTALTDLWANDQGVTYADGSAMVLADSPSSAEYAPPNDPSGVYTFSAVDAGKDILISYGSTPRDVEEACVSLVILEYNRRSRIGENTKSLAGENVSYYTQASFTPMIEDRLRNYINVVPVL